MRCWALSGRRSLCRCLVRIQITPTRRPRFHKDITSPIFWVSGLGPVYHVCRRLFPSLFFNLDFAATTAVSTVNQVRDGKNTDRCYLVENENCCTVENACRVLLYARTMYCDKTQESFQQ